MTAEALASRLAARGIHYGWVILGLGYFHSLFPTKAPG